MTDDEKALAAQAAEAERAKAALEEEEDEIDGENSRDIKKLKEEAKKWRIRAKENIDGKDALVKAQEAEKRVRELETRANNTLLEVQKMQQLADKRMIDAELKSLANEYGLKKLEYARLGEGYEKLRVNVNGDVEGARDMIDKLKKSDPDLFRSATTTNVNFQSHVKGVNESEKKVLKLSAAEYEKAKREHLRASR